MTTQSKVDLNLRCPYQANVIKILDIVNRAIGKRYLIILRLYYKISTRRIDYHKGFDILLLGGFYNDRKIRLIQV